MATNNNRCLAEETAHSFHPSSQPDPEAATMKRTANLAGFAVWATSGGYVQFGNGPMTSPNTLSGATSPTAASTTSAESSTASTFPTVTATTEGTTTRSNVGSCGRYAALINWFGVEIILEAPLGVRRSPRSSLDTAAGGHPTMYPNRAYETT